MSPQKSLISSLIMTLAILVFACIILLGLIVLIDPLMMDFIRSTEWSTFTFFGSDAGEAYISTMITLFVLFGVLSGLYAYTMYLSNKGKYRRF